MQARQKKSVTSWLRSITHRELAENSTSYFLGYYLGMWTLPHRAEMLEHIEEPDQYILLLYPRDHLKTSSVTAYLIKRLLYNPSLRILCVSNTKELAIQNVGAIKAPMENNPKLLRDFGDVRGEPWGTEKFTLR